MVELLTLCADCSLLTLKPAHLSPYLPLAPNLYFAVFFNTFCATRHNVKVIQSAFLVLWLSSPFRPFCQVRYWCGRSIEHNILHKIISASGEGQFDHIFSLLCSPCITLKVSVEQFSIPVFKDKV